jgi:hypothetical protein
VRIKEIGHHPSLKYFLLEQHTEIYCHAPSMLSQLRFIPNRRHAEGFGLSSFGKPAMIPYCGKLSLARRTSLDQTMSFVLRVLEAKSIKDGMGTDVP